MSFDAAIKVEGISKCYQIYSKPRDRLLQMLMRGRKQYFREFWALSDVSFEVPRGETVGIVGRNGSGKSTLLQIICGTLRPTNGHVETAGRIGALLELGSGFNPEFSGRENVYMNATLLGLSREEIDQRFESIVDFADIGDFIDQPVKTYSSGMAVRLAFAVQAQVNPDILIVDEALAVGDAKFQARCFERLKQLKKNGTSILLVTHSTEQIVTHCSQALLLVNGRVAEQGNPREVTNRYIDILFGKERKIDDSALVSKESSSLVARPDQPCKPTYPLSTNIEEFSTHPGYNPQEYRWGDGLACVLDFYLSADDEKYPVAVCTGQTITLAISIHFRAMIVRPILGITIKTKEGVTVYGVNSESLSVDAFHNLGLKDSTVIAEATFSCHLAPGDYFISIGLASRQGEDVVPHDRRYDSIHIQVLPDNRFFGLANLGAKMAVKEMA